MRHTLVPIQLIHQARPATPARVLTDAPPDESKARRARRARRRRRLAAVARRARTA
jgi:hypothetical protein